MTKHTLGPWRVGAMGYSNYQIVTDNDTPLIVGVIHDPTNARLIAAAPDLLAVAEIFATFLADNGGDEHYHDADGTGWLTIARAAIAKATGDA